MSTLPNQPSVLPSWKQEINRRIAAHRSRQSSAASGQEELSETHHNASTRAVAAAARVAARYANAPSYSELLAGEARAAVRAAEAASRAALEAQAAAEQVLAGLEAASAAEPVWELHSSSVTASKRQAWQARQEAQEGQENLIAKPPFQEAIPASPDSEGQAFDRQAFEIRWEPDLPVRRAESAGFRATHGAEFSEDEMENRIMPAWPDQDGLDGESIEAVEPDLPIHANLIEFPREIVATRKARPRRAEGAFAASVTQLSIFEVDPGAISIDPSGTAAMDLASSPGWTGQEWPGIKLGEQPRHEIREEPAHESTKEPPAAIDLPKEAPAVTLAPLNLRLMAAVVNSSLVAGAFLVAAMVAVANAKDLPSLREIEVGSAVAVLVVGVLYQAFFYALARATPGMMYAGISLSTLDGRLPTRAQRCSRLGALLLSLLPVGLGVVWAIFDDDHLSWHDRLSGTYLRKY